MGDGENLEESLLPEEGQEVNYQESVFVWKSGQLWRKTEDGGLVLVDAGLDAGDTAEDEEGNKWLTQDAEGNVLIQVSLRVWATINFEYNSDAISPESEGVLMAFAKALNRPALKEKKLLISGHTDNVGSDTFNLSLSRRRAASVGRYLSEKGNLDPERLILNGYGAKLPVADNSSPEGMAKNRRVEFVLLP
jgi:outer membrane protein OmpA-like peptidoglycan-associated protein